MCIKYVDFSLEFYEIGSPFYVLDDGSMHGQRMPREEIAKIFTNLTGFSMDTDLGCREFGVYLVIMRL